MPYAPGISYQGDRYLFQGTQQAGSNIRDFIGYLVNQKQQKDQARAILGPMLDGASGEQRQTMQVQGANEGTGEGEESPENERMKRMGRVADSSRRMLEDLGIVQKDQLKTMSLGQLLGTIKGVALKHEEQQQAQQAETTALNNQRTRLMMEDLLNARRAATTRQSQIDTATEGVFNALGDASPTNETSVRAALARNPMAANNPNFDNVLRVLMPTGTDQAPAPAGFEVNGIKGIYSPKGGQFEVDPLMKVQAQAESRQLKPPKWVKQVDADGDVIPGLYYDTVNKIEKHIPPAYETTTEGGILNPTVTRRPISATTRPRPTEPEDPPAKPNPAKPAALPANQIIVTGPQGQTRAILKSQRGAFLKTFSDWK